jgi:hypothetical protein
MLYRILSDMELEAVYGIQTNFHSRTKLEHFSHLPGGETTATMRMQGGKGNVQYPKVWMDWVINVLNKGNKSSERYLFREAGGIQNSSIKGRMEELACEGNIVESTKIIGNKIFIKTFHTDELPPKNFTLGDARINRITVVDRNDKLTRSTTQEVYFPLMARPGEDLWIPLEYLTPVVTPEIKKPILELIIYDDYTIKETRL